MTNSTSIYLHKTIKFRRNLEYVLPRRRNQQIPSCYNVTSGLFVIIISVFAAPYIRAPSLFDFGNIKARLTAECTNATQDLLTNSVLRCVGGMEAWLTA